MLAKLVMFCSVGFFYWLIWLERPTSRGICNPSILACVPSILILKWGFTSLHNDIIRDACLISLKSHFVLQSRWQSNVFIFSIEQSRISPRISRRNFSAYISRLATAAAFHQHKMCVCAYLPACLPACGVVRGVTWILFWLNQQLRFNEPTEIRSSWRACSVISCKELFERKEWATAFKCLRNNNR